MSDNKITTATGEDGFANAMIGLQKAYDTKGAGLVVTYHDEYGEYYAMGKKSEITAVLLSAVEDNEYFRDIILEVHRQYFIRLLKKEL